MYMLLIARQAHSSLTFSITILVIMARKAGPITHFYGDPESFRKPHAGLIVPMFVQQRFRGPYENGSLIFVHFITGRDDHGVQRAFIPFYDHPFILTGKQNSGPFFPQLMAF